MPVTNYLSSVKELPDCVTIHQNTNCIWELRIKGMLLCQAASQEHLLNYFSENANKWEDQIGIDLTPKVIEEAVIVKPASFINRLLNFLAR